MTTVGQKRYITVGYITRTTVIAVNDSLGLTDNTTATPSAGASGWIYGANGTYQPGATTSGVPTGTTLTSHTTGFVVTTAGTLISSMNVSGIGIDIKAANVTVSKSLVTGLAGSADCVVDCRWPGCVNALVEDCELAPAVLHTYTNCVMGHDVTWQRCNIHGGTDGVRSATNNLGGAGVQANGRANAYLLGNYVHGLAGWLSDPSQSGASHNDPWQPEGGNYNVAIGNFFDGHIDGTLGQGTATTSNWNGGNHPIPGSTATNSCIQFNHNTATQTTGCTVNNNWLSGGYIAINVSLGAGQQVDSISNNIFIHGTTTSNVEIILSGTAVPSRTNNVFDTGGAVTVQT